VKRSSFVIIFFFLSLFGFSQTAKYSNEFLSIGVGARGLALSNSLTAITNDVTSGYWNPAGLSRMEQKYQLSLMHAAYFANIANYDYAALAYKIDTSSAIALSFIRLGIDNIMNTLFLVDNQGNFDYSRISTFSTADMAFLLSYSYNFPQVKGLSVGGSAKIIKRNLGSFADAWGFGIDAGIQYHRSGWHAGALLRDASSTFNAWNYHLNDEIIAVFEQTENEIPTNSLEITLPKLIIGGGKQVDFGKGFNATFVLDCDFAFDKQRHTLISGKVISLDPHFGMEFGYKNIVALRTGIGNFQQEKDFNDKTKTSLQINLGLGICIKNIVTIDYALTDIGNLSIAPYSHVFSLKLALNHFSKKPKKTDN
jgi:hypothetical protein